MSALVHGGQKRALNSSAAGITGGCEPPDTGDGV